MIYKNLDIEGINSLALEFARNLKGNELILLEGELSAGKTTFTKALLSYFGISRVKSPTFNICNRYDSKFTFYHLDMYRLDDVDYDILDIINSNGIKICEWPKFKPSCNYFLIKFSIVSESLRDVSITEVVCTD